MILVTGSTGFMGSKLVKKLISQGHKVRGMVLENDPYRNRVEGTGCEIVVGDITKPESLEKPFSGIKTVFHLAAVLVSHNKELFRRVNYEGTKNVVEKSIEAGVEHFIYISAAAANYKTRTDYGDSKIEAEGLMKGRGNTNFTIIRPALIYGNDGGQEFGIYVRYLKKFPLIIPFVGFGTARKKPVWVEDIVDGLCKLVNKPITYGKIYNFSGGSDVSMWGFTHAIRKQLKIRKIVIPIPVPICYFIANVYKIASKNPMLNRNTILGITMDGNFSHEEAQSDIGYSPVTLEEGLQKSFPDHVCNFV